MPRQPVGLPGHAPFRAVVVESVEDNQILARDQHGASMALPRLIRVREPIVGETWLVDRTFGTWTLAAVVDSLADPYEHVPTGAMMDFAGAEAPSGWLLTDGALYQIEDHPDLFDVIGTTYGGDGSTTFRVPDRRGRVSIGKGTLGSDTYSLAATGGEARHVLSIAEMPRHDHGNVDFNGGHAHTNPNVNGNGGHSHPLRVRDAPTISKDHGHVDSANRVSTASGADGTNRNHSKYINSDGNHAHSQGNTGNNGNHNHNIPHQGNDNAHENRPPYLVVTHIIKT